MDFISRVESTFQDKETIQKLIQRIYELEQENIALKMKLLDIQDSAIKLANHFLDALHEVSGENNG